jgi:hypothetical protein
MSLTQKFKDAVSGPAVSFSSLYLDTRYPVVHAKRVETRYGMRVVVGLYEEDAAILSKYSCRNDTATPLKIRIWMI